MVRKAVSGKLVCFKTQENLRCRTIPATTPPWPVPYCTAPSTEAAAARLTSATAHLPEHGTSLLPAWELQRTAPRSYGLRSQAD